MEISLEIEFCVRRENVYKIFERCIELNKKVIITSDIYLPLEVIKNIRKKQYQCLYESFLFGVCKKDGKLFELIMKN